MVAHRPALTNRRKDRPMAKRPLPSPELLRQLLRYEPETGKLFWRERPVEMFPAERHWKMWNTRFSGKEAFTASNTKGYLLGHIFGRLLLSHRVIWAMVTGAWPTDKIDHEDHDSSNNRWNNLREASQLENLRNQSLRPSNKSGVTGVHWNKRDKKWEARIRVSGQQIFLGYFDDISLAAAARAAANVKYGFHENHGKVAAKYHAKPEDVRFLRDHELRGRT